MRKDSVYKKVRWIDLENPTSSEVRQLIEEFDIAPVVANELISPSIRSHVDFHPKFLYLILHFPCSYSPNADETETKKTQEIDFIIGKDFIITTHYDSIDALQDFSKVFEVQSILDKSDFANHGGYVFFYMAKHLYKQMINKVEMIQDLISDTERKIFQGQERRMVTEISRLNRVVLTYKEALGSHEEILGSFEIAGHKFFGEDFKYHLHAILGEYSKVAKKIENTKEYLHELRMTNDSLLSTKQNEIMKNLTLMSFLFFPLALVAGIFGMNADFMPIIGTPNDFWKILSIMLVLTIIMFILFKQKKWF
jgi:magnesium transporter